MNEVSSSHHTAEYGSDRRNSLTVLSKLYFDTPALESTRTQLQEQLLSNQSNSNKGNPLSVDAYKHRLRDAYSTAKSASD